MNGGGDGAAATAAAVVRERNCQQPPVRSADPKLPHQPEYNTKLIKSELC